MEDVKANAPMIAMMVKLANDFAQRMSEQKKDRGIIDFNDMEHLALDILVKNNAGIIEYTRTADELAESFDEILIDEYQDSNQLQEEILTAVSRQRMSDYFNNRFKYFCTNFYYISVIRNIRYRTVPVINLRFSNPKIAGVAYTYVISCNPSSIT